ncbi:MAG: 3-hydroxyacyl-CoA dehydrogenase [Actinomycetota bacterium]
MAATGIASDAPVGVVGAGTMGAGIAEVAARAGHPVTLVDVAPGAASAAVDASRARLDRDAAKGRLTPQEARDVAARLHAGTSVEDLRGCALVVEAVVERLDVKRELFSRLEDLVGSSALLATNTSSLSVTAVASALRHPGRVVGLHFFNPATRMRLVEVVRGDATDDAVVEAATELARAWGKTPVVCTSTPGFIVNRVARPFYGEAQRIVEEGVADPATVDAVLREAGGFPMGPFELTDLVGQDVNLAVSTSVWQQTFGDQRYAPTVFQQRLVDAGRLGRKTGRGVFTYSGNGPTDAEPSTEPRRGAPAVVEHVVQGEDRGFVVMGPFLDRMAGAGVRLARVEGDEESGSDPGIRLPGGAMLLEQQGDSATATWGEGGAVVLLDWAHDPATCTRVALTPSPDTPEESLNAAVGLCQAAGAQVSVVRDSPGGIVARTVAMLVNEAVELVARGEATAEDVDVAMLLGTGYPSGPLEWGDRLGALTVATVVERLHDAYPSGRYRAAPSLARSVRAGVNLRDL